jgi:hypothetical protein
MNIKASPWGKHDDLFTIAVANPKIVSMPKLSKNHEIAYSIFKTFKELVIEKYGRDEWESLIKSPIKD